MVDTVLDLQAEATKIIERERTLRERENALRANIRQLQEQLKTVLDEEAKNKDAARALMEKTNENAIETPVGKIMAEEGRPSVVVEDVNALPDECKRIKVEANKTLILKKIIAGEAINGAHVKFGDKVIKFIFSS